MVSTGNSFQGDLASWEINSLENYVSHMERR